MLLVERAGAGCDMMADVLVVKFPAFSVPFIPHSEPMIARKGKAANPRILFGKFKKIIRVVRGGVKQMAV